LIKDDDLKHILEAFVNMQNWIINFKYPSNFLEIFTTLQQQYKLYNLYEPNSLKCPEIESNSFYIYQQELYSFLAGISFHEFGHSKECPIDLNYFSLILQAVSTVLEKKSIFNKILLYYIVNQFTDLIVNTLYGLNTDNVFFRNSIFTFYFSELILFNTTDLSFYFFILLNLKLYQFHMPIRDAFEKVILPKMPQNHDEIVKRIMGIFCPFDALLENLIVGVKITENERWKIINHLTERDNWGKLAYQYTEIICDFVSKDLLEDHQPVPDSFFTIEFEENSRFRKEVLDKILEQKLEKKISKSFTKKVNGGKKQVEKFLGELDIEYGFNGFENIEKYDALYRYRTKKLEIFVPTLKEDAKFTLTWLNREIMSEKDNILNFDPFNVYFLPKSDELLLFKKKVPLTIDYKGIIMDKGFPNLAIFCDDSGSMTWEPLTGKGKYDALIITIYSLFKWLTNKSFAPVIEYNFTFFSDTTRSTGWVDYYHLDEIKQLLFFHEGGGTIVEPITFENILNNPKKKAVILITDGEIYNYEDIFEIINQFKNNLDFLFIQIGQSSKFANKLKQHSFNVMTIQNISKLSEIVLNFVKNTYQSSN